VSMAARLQSNGVPVELRVLPGQPHDFGPNRLQVFRAVGEYCLTRLNGPDALENYRSIVSVLANPYRLARLQRVS